MIKMIALLSLVTSVKDYTEIVHKLLEYHPNYSATGYADFGSILSYVLLTLRHSLIDFFSFYWLQNIWSLPIVVPDIASAMISEISVLDGHFHNAFTFLETPLSYGKQNYSLYGLEKFTIGLINSFFLFLPTSAAHLILLRRFVFQGIEGGYLAGIGTIAGNILWVASIIFGWRFFVIPWLSLDILRYLLGFVILIQFMWHASRDRRTFSNLSKKKIVLVNFLLAFTEQTSIYPFVTNMSVGAESSILETFPVDNFGQFCFIHSAYILGLLAGSLSLLHFTCWLWENPIAKLYNYLRIRGSLSPHLYQNLKFIFLYLIMLCTIASIPYFGLDYTLTNPLGLISDDRILYQINKKTNQPLFPEASFINGQASERHARNARGRHGRRERWKDRLMKFKGTDTALYDQGIYDLFTIEDLNYGFDKFWLRRKMRNRRSRFKMLIFKPWFLALKKQLAKPKLISNEAARIELFRMLQDQFYHPNFHAYSQNNSPLLSSQKAGDRGLISHQNVGKGELGHTPSVALPTPSLSNTGDGGTIRDFSALKKFVRKINTRVKASEILFAARQNNNSMSANRNGISLNQTPINSKFLNLNKQALSQLQEEVGVSKRGSSLTAAATRSPQEGTSLAIGAPRSGLIGPYSRGGLKIAVNDLQEGWQKLNNNQTLSPNPMPLSSSAGENRYTPANYEGVLLSKKDRKILRYKTILSLPSNSPVTARTPAAQKANLEINNANTMLHPIKFYLQKEKAFRRKFKFYGASIFRKLSIENNAPYFRTMMKRLFYFYKPTLRWKNTIKLAKNYQGRKTRKKKSRIPLTLHVTRPSSGLAHAPSITLPTPSVDNPGEVSLRDTKRSITKPTHAFRVVGKNASRVRNQITKQALLNWFYTPFNRVLLKLDVDLFIRRQPNSHFLTKKDEQKLHLKRFLLAEHYDTLRWYTYMQHYRSMKTKIGGTKSFASRVYNQQFQGTLKKIRHLFAITPSQSGFAEGEGNILPLTHEVGLNAKTSSILKFDQPLYNEYTNSKNNSIINKSVTHEELLSPYINVAYPLSGINSTLISPQNVEAPAGGGVSLFPNLKEDFIAQSTLIVRDYLKTSKPMRQQIITDLLSKNNYKELAKFSFNGRKNRGIKAVTNQRSFLNQEKLYLVGAQTTDGLSTVPTSFTAASGIPHNEGPASREITNIQLINFLKTTAKNLNIEQDLWFSLLKNYQKGLYDQEFLTKFVERRVRLREERQQQTEKELKKRLNHLQTWLAPNFLLDSEKLISVNNETQKSVSGNSLTTGLNKAIKDGLLLFENGAEPLDLRSQSPTVITQDFANSLSDPVLPSILKQFNTEKESLQDSNPSRVDKLLSVTGITKIKIVANILATKIKRVIKLIINETPSSAGVFKAIKKKDFSWWQIQERMFQKQKHLRKRYTKLMKEKAAKINEINKKNEKNKPIEHKKKRQARLDAKHALLYKNARTSGKYPSVDLVPGMFGTQGYRHGDDAQLSIVRNDTGELSLKPCASPVCSVFKISKMPKTKGVLHQVETRAPKGDSPSSEIERKKRNSDNDNSPLTGVSRIVPQFTSDTLSVGGSPLTFVYLNKLYNKVSLPNEPSIPSRSEGGDQTLSGPKALIAKLDSMGLKNLTAWVKNIKPNLRRHNLKSRGYQHLVLALSSVERPSLNVNLEPLSTLVTNEKRVQTIKQTLLSFGSSKEFSLTTNLPKKTKSNIRTWQKYKKGVNGAKSQKTKHNPMEVERLMALQRFSALTAQIKRIQFNLKLQQWWWQKFLPNIQATAEAAWQLEKDRQLQQTISKLSKTEILEQDSITHGVDMPHTVGLTHSLPAQSVGAASLQIGDYDFKPLAVPQALRIRENLQKHSATVNVAYPLSGINPTVGGYATANVNSLPFYAGWDESLRKFVVTNRLLSRREAGYTSSLLDSTNMEFTDSPLQGMNAGATLYSQTPFTTFDPDQMFLKGMDGFAPLGWRRFAFTHTILKTNTLFNWLNLRSNKTRVSPHLSDLPQGLRKEQITSTLSGNTQDTSLNVAYPLSGINSTVGGTPTQWVNTLRNSKPLLIKNISYRSAIAKEPSSVLTSDIFTNRVHTIGFKKTYNNNLDTIRKTNNYSRRLKRHYRRLRTLQNEKVPLFLMSGPLISEVLPINYINVFNKQSRLPKDRYLQRRLRRGKKAVPNTIKELNAKNFALGKMDSYESTLHPMGGRGQYDFTFRRRVKSRRKYHSKPPRTRGIEVRPRRHKFLIDYNPLRGVNYLNSTNKTERDGVAAPGISMPAIDLRGGVVRKRPTKRRSKKNIPYKKNSSGATSKLKRSAALKRRISRQIIKVVPRRRPRSGGFVWPGDYLRLEQTESPKLMLRIEGDTAANINGGASSVSQSGTLEGSEATKLQITRQLKAGAQLPREGFLDLYVQPRKYLLEKHNIKIIKKKLEKVQRTSKITQRIIERTAKVAEIL